MELDFSKLSDIAEKTPEMAPGSPEGVGGGEKYLRSRKTRLRGV